MISVEETEEGQEEEQQKDEKIGEIELREGSVLVVKKTNYNGEDRIDFRVWMNTSRYKGPTKQGFVVTMDKVDKFLEILEDMKKFGGQVKPEIVEVVEEKVEKKLAKRKRKQNK